MSENLSTILRSTEPTVLTTGWGRTEGPLWHAEGSVTFVDLAGSRLLRWDPNGQVTVVREQTGEGNGCALIGIIKTPEVVRSLAFGGPDFCTLYLTPGGSLATLEVTTPGIGARRA